MAFLFKLETVDGAPAEPPTLEASRPELASGRRDLARTPTVHADRARDGLNRRASINPVESARVE